MSFLGKILSENQKVPPAIKNERMAICKSCPYFKSGTGSCGTFMVGEKITHNGFPAKLCGCIMNEKTELKGAYCPISKWSTHYM